MSNHRSRIIRLERKLAPLPLPPDDDDGVDGLEELRAALARVSRRLREPLGLGPEDPLPPEVKTNPPVARIKRAETRVVVKSPIRPTILWSRI